MSVAERLKYARKHSGLTLAQVQERTNIGKSSVSDFENGKGEPKLSHLQTLAELYRRPFSFFLAEGPIPHEVVLWRERPANSPRQLEAEFLRLCEQYHNLEMWCGEHVRSCLPDWEGDAAAFDYADAEDLASRVRRELQLGDRPAQGLLGVLEEVCGVKVFHKEFEPSGAAASTKSETSGHAILLNSINVRWRRNFDLAHELFHLLTWDTFRSETDRLSCVAGEQEEKFANCFASNLLVPSEATRGSVKRRMRAGSVSMEALFDIAREFDVSVQALLWRLHYLYRRGPQGRETTERDVRTAEASASLFEKRDKTPPPKWPARYHALAVKALRRGEMSIGRCAEYLDISRQKAAAYIQPGVEDAEEIQLAPA